MKFSLKQEKSGKCRFYRCSDPHFGGGFLVKGRNIHIPFALDASVYAWNREAVHTLKKMGPEFITMPWELNSRELKAVATACEKEDMQMK